MFCVVNPLSNERSLAQSTSQQVRSIAGVWTTKDPIFTGNSQGCVLGYRGTTQVNGQTVYLNQTEVIGEIEILQQGNRISTPPVTLSGTGWSYTMQRQGTVTRNQIRMTISGGGFNHELTGVISADGNTITGQSLCRFQGGRATAQASFTWTRKNLLPTSRLITFRLSNTQQVAPDTVQLEMNSTQGEGCRFISVIKKSGDRVYQDSIRFIASSEANCGMESFTSTFQPGAKQITVQTGRESLTVTPSGSSAQVLYQDASGSRSLNSIPLTPRSGGSSASSSSSAFSQLCEFFKGACNTISSISDGSFILKPISVALQQAYPELGNIKYAKSVEPALRALGVLAGQASGVLVGGAAVKGISRLVPGLGAALMVADFTCWFLIKGGLPPIPVLEGVSNKFTDFAYQFAGVASEGTGVTNEIDKGLATIRKALGIDICGQPQTSTPATTTCNIPQEFWRSHRRVIGPVNLYEDRCLIKGPVMTRDGQADGQTSCGICFTPGLNFGPLPHKVSCNYREDPARRNPISTCPSG